MSAGNDPETAPGTWRLAPRRLRDLLAVVGPGVVVAATGVGAGDLIAAAKAGATFGLPLLWAALFGAVLKFALAEGVARWQLATGTTVLEGWVQNFGRAVQVAFLVFLVLWSVMVAAALMSACGLAAYALCPALSVNAWAVIHSLLGLFLVWARGYRTLEAAMKVAVAVMFLSITGSAVAYAPPVGRLLRSLAVPAIPAGSTVLVMSALGGVGGSLTLLSYNYWVREKGWSGPQWARGVRFDLGVGYLITGVFGASMMLLAAQVLRPRGIAIEGGTGVLDMAVILGDRFGRAGELVFLIGFWAAVATSLAGVWQGVPYLFADYARLLWARKNAGAPPAEPISQSRRAYRGYLLFMTFPPMLLLLLGKPVWLVVAYTAISSLFMPYLAFTLLVMNNRRGAMGSLRNGRLANAGLVVALALFAYLAIQELAR